MFSFIILALAIAGMLLAKILLGEKRKAVILGVMLVVLIVELIYLHSMGRI